MVGPANVLRHYEVLVSLHPRGATLGSEGVGVVTDIDPVCPRVSPVRGGQAGGIHHGQGCDCDGDDGVHLVAGALPLSVLMIKLHCCGLLYPITMYFFKDNNISKTLLFAV